MRRRGIDGPTAGRIVIDSEPFPRWLERPWVWVCGAADDPRHPDLIVCAGGDCYTHADAVVDAMEHAWQAHGVRL